jgi:hypothetical protein
VKRECWDNAPRIIYTILHLDTRCKIVISCTLLPFYAGWRAPDFKLTGRRVCPRLSVAEEIFRPASADEFLNSQIFPTRFYTCMPWGNIPSSLSSLIVLIRTGFHPSALWSTLLQLRTIVIVTEETAELEYSLRLGIITTVFYSH